MGIYSQRAGEVGLDADNEIAALTGERDSLRAAVTSRDIALANNDALIRDLRAQLAAATSKVEPYRAGQPTFKPPAAKPKIVGVNYHGIWDERTPAIRARILDELQAAGVGWVRLDVAWADFQPTAGTFGGGKTTRIDEVVGELAGRGIKVLLLIYWAPSWATGTTNKNGVPRDPQQYADACAWAAKRWAGKVQAIELWNEPDLPDFLAGTSVDTWMGLVKATYPKIKAAVPDMLVVSGAASAMKDAWHTRAFDLGLLDACDVVGVHSYQGSADKPPDYFDPNYRQYYTANLANVVKRIGGKPIWITEYGWSVRANTTTTKEWERGVTDAQQADHLIAMQSYVSQWPSVKATFWYNDWSKATGNPFQDGFGLLQRDYGRRRAWYAMRCVAGGVCGP